MTAILSHGQLLAALEASQAVIDQMTTELATQRAVRDNIIVRLLEEKTPYRTIQKLTGLSRNAVVAIQANPRRVVDMPFNL
jgi:hypothetical protein